MKLLQSLFIMCLLAIFNISAVSAQWVPTNGPIEGRTYTLAVGIDAGGDTTLYAGTWNGGVFSSTNNGDNWNRIDGRKWWTIEQSGDTGFTSNDIVILAATQNGKGGICLFAGDTDGNIFRSINADTNWIKINPDFGKRHVGPFVIINDSNIFAISDSVVFLSTNFGKDWAMYNNELAQYGVYSLLVFHAGINKTQLFATTSEGIFRSTNNGINWNIVNYEARNYYGLVYSYTKPGGVRFFAIDRGKIVSSIDSCIHWNALSELDSSLNYTIYTIEVSDSIVYAGTDFYGMYYSLDYGKNWKNGNYGRLPNWGIYKLLVSGNYLFAATSSYIGESNSVWRRALSNIILRILDENKLNISKLILNQNYPNPFNPTTTISFSLKEREYVSLKIYDIIGREIVTLVSKELSAGKHTIIWEASGAPSGIYFYRLTTASGVITKKMLLIK